MRIARPFSTLPRAFWWSLLAYAGITAWQGQDVLRALGSVIIHDVGDPLLNATILSWNAQNLPWTQSWWNLPIFAPTPDVLTFSEHLLGLAPISTPVYWATGSGLVAYNLTALLTFPLCGAAMFLLVHQLTGSGAAGFLAGLAYAFAPYRFSHLPHIQILAAFWMPLALLGLHRYLDNGKRRWLLLFGISWFLQGAANGYYLVFFSVLVGLWVVWFVLVRGRWAALWRIGAVGIVASLPLWPIVQRYVAVHRMYGFTRSLPEVEFYSADVAGVLCASQLLQWWQWLRIGCKPEGELFSGITVPLACVLAIFFLWRSSVSLPRSRPLRAAVLLAFGVAGVYIAIALSVWWFGRWRMELGPLTATASSFNKPFSVAVWAALMGFALTARSGRLTVSAATAFYAFAAWATWMLALGPIPRLSQERAFEIAPYAWLMSLPGADSLRVPARFWMITVLCLAILMGLLVSRVLGRISRPAMRAIMVVLGCGLLIDGWARIPVVDAPDMLWADRLARTTALELPIEEVDTAAGLRAAEGGWRAVNGYSGYRPPSYDVIRAALRAEDGSFLSYLSTSEPLNVTVRKDAPRMVNMVAREAPSGPVAESADRVLFRIPQRAVDTRFGSRHTVARVTASCSQDIAHMLIDGRLDIAWDCGPQLTDEQLLMDLGRTAVVGAVRQVGGQRPSDHPRDLVIETSVDGATWQPAWAGGVAGRVFQVAVAHPTNVAIVLPFEARPARYVRLRQVGRDSRSVWAVSEVEIYEPALKQ